MRQWLARRRWRYELLKLRKSSRTYHTEMRSATFTGSLASTIGLLVADGAAGADGIEFLAGGELRFGVTTAESEMLPEGGGDRGYTSFADSELYIKAEISQSEDLAIGAEIILKADADSLDEANADETFMFLSGAFGLMQLGRADGAWC